MIAYCASYWANRESVDAGQMTAEQAGCNPTRVETYAPLKSWCSYCYSQINPTIGESWARAAARERERSGR
jgi:hypothetical protein